MIEKIFERISCTIIMAGALVMIWTSVEGFASPVKMQAMPEQIKQILERSYAYETLMLLGLIMFSFAIFIVYSWRIKNNFNHL